MWREELDRQVARAAVLNNKLNSSNNKTSRIWIRHNWISTRLRNQIWMQIQDKEQAMHTKSIQIISLSRFQECLRTRLAMFSKLLRQVTKITFSLRILNHISVQLKSMRKRITLLPTITYHRLVEHHQQALCHRDPRIPRIFSIKWALQLGKLKSKIVKFKTKPKVLSIWKEIKGQSAGQMIQRLWRQRLFTRLKDQSQSNRQGTAIMERFWGEPTANKFSKSEANK